MLVIQLGSCLGVTIGEVWDNPWWGGWVSLERQPWRTGVGEFGEATPGGEAPQRGRRGPLPLASRVCLLNSPAPVLQGCLPKRTCPCSPRVASVLSYCNSQVRAKLDDQHDYRGMRFQVTGNTLYLFGERGCWSSRMECEFCLYLHII